MPKNRYELVTTENVLEMPEVIHAGSREEAKEMVRKKLRKGEEIISLERV